MSARRPFTICALALLAGLAGFTALPAATLTPEQKAPEIVSALLDSLSFSAPVILDIRCGEWTPALETEMRKLLLQRQVEVREISFGLLRDSREYGPLAMETDYGLDGTALLQMVNLDRADYLELNLEHTVVQGEKRNLVSFSRYNMPVYKFDLKQITLPGQRLAAVREYRLEGVPEIENPGSLLALKWYEPVLATAILGSLVYLLWTIK